MDRKLHTTVPIIPKLLHPTSLNYSKLTEKEKYFRKKQKATFDGRHRARAVEIAYGYQTLKQEVPLNDKCLYDPTLFLHHLDL